MPPVYPPEVKEVCRTLYRQGVGTIKTRELLMSGEAVGIKGSWSPGISTIEKWRNEFKRDGDLKGFAVGREDKDVVCEAVFLEFLAIGRLTMKELREKTLKGTATAADVTRARGFIVGIDGHQSTRARKAAGKAPDTGTAKQGAPSSMLAKLTADRKARDHDQPGHQDPSPIESEGGEATSVLDDGKGTEQTEAAGTTAETQQGPPE